MVSTVLAHLEQRITSTLGSIEYDDWKDEDEDDESDEALENV